MRTVSVTSGFWRKTVLLELGIEGWLQSMACDALIVKSLHPSIVTNK